MIEQIYGNTPLGWSLVTIAELINQNQAELQTGPFGTMLHASAYRPIGTPVVAVKNIAENRLDHSDIPHVDIETVSRLSRYQLNPGDILFGRKGAVDRRALVRVDEAGWLQGSDCIRLRFLTPKIDPCFVSYVLGSPQYRAWIIRNAHGATMPSLNQNIIGRIPLPLPPLPEQHAIARILGTLDDKIELNRRMNATLEAMAQAIFKSWFVDFDPVRAKMEGREPVEMDAETAALFPDAFEEVDGQEVPEGWSTGTLGDVAENIRKGIQADGIDPGANNISLAEMPRNCIALETWIKAGNIDSNKFEFKEGQILFGKLRPYFHKVGVAPVDGVCSTDILVVAPKNHVYYSLVLMQISSDPFIDYVTRSSTGTKMPRTNWDTMARYPVTIPSLEVLERFERTINPMLQRIRHNVRQSRTLAALRDTLLPKLISGEIRVPTNTVSQTPEMK